MSTQSLVTILLLLNVSVSVFKNLNDSQQESVQKNESRSFQTFVDINGSGTNSCRIFSSNDQFVELQQLRQQNLKLERTLSDLQVLLKAQQNCPASDLANMEQIEQLKSQISSLMVRVELIISNQGGIGSNHQELVDLLRTLQAQSNNMMTMTQQLINRVPQSNCAEIQSLIQTENSSLERKLTVLWSKYDGLMQTNQELNQFIVQLQGDKEDMTSLKQEIQNNQISLSQLSTENANLTRLIRDLKNGNNTDELFEQVRAVSQENGRLQQELNNCQDNATTNEELKVLRNQNVQLQSLVQQLGTQLFDQAKQYKQEQEYENEIASLKSEMATLRVQLQKEQDTVIMVQRESSSTATMLNDKMNDQQVDLDVCRSSVSTLQVQLRDSQSNTQNMGTLLANNKSLSDNLTQCRSQNSNLESLRAQLSIVTAELNTCNDQSREQGRTIENLNATLTRVTTQRDEFQVQVASMSSLQSQLNNCNSNVAQLRESNANLGNLQSKIGDLEGQIIDRRSLLQQINVLRSEMTMNSQQCQQELKQLETDFNAAQTDLAACRQSNDAIQVTIQNLRGDDNEARELRTLNASLNQRLAESDSKAQQCAQQVTFLNRVEVELNQTQDKLDDANNEVNVLRNQLAISNNERSRCQLEAAQVTELERRIKDMQEEANQLNAVTQQIGDLSQQISNSSAALDQSNQRYQEMRTRFDTCFAQQNNMNEQLDQCQNNLSLSQSTVQRIERDLQVSMAGNARLQNVSEENRNLASRLETLQQTLTTTTQRCDQLDSITIQLNTCNLSRNDQEGELDQCQQDQELNRLRIAQLEAQNSNIALLQNQVNQKDVLIANLSKQNDSFVTLQVQIDDYVTQLREKQTIESRNSQLQKDLDSLKVFSDREINRLNLQLEQSRTQLTACADSTKTLQTQLISLSSENQNAESLQQQFNVCSETLRNTRNEVSQLNAQLRVLSGLQVRVETLSNELNQSRSDLSQCTDESKQFATTIQALQLQVSTISNLQAQIVQLTSQINDYRNQNEALRNLEGKLEDIQNVQAQTELLNSQLRVQIQNNQTVREECEQEQAQILITLNTLRGEKSASDRLVEQLRQDLQRFSNTQSATQSQLLNENSNLKSQLAVVSQQLQECNNQNANLTRSSSQLTRIQVELTNCQAQSKQNSDNNEALTQRVLVIPALQQTIAEQEKQIEALKSEISNYQRIQVQLEQFQVSLNQNVQLNSQIQNLRDQLAKVQSELDQNTSNYRVQVTRLQSNLESCQQNNEQLQKNVENLTRNNNVVGTLQTENRTLTQRILVLTQDSQNCQRELSVTQRIQLERDNCLSTLAQSQKDLAATKEQNVNLLIQVNTIPQLNNRIRTLEESLTTSNSRNQELNTLTIRLNALQTAATERDQFRLRLERCEQEKSVMQETSSKQITDLRVEITTVRTNFNNCNQTNQDLRTQITEITQRQPNINQLEQEKAQLNSRVIQLTSSTQSLTQQVNSLTQRVQACAQLQGNLDEANKSISVLRIQINNQQNELNNCAAKDQQIATLNQRLVQLNGISGQNANLRAQLAESKESIVELNATMISIRTQLQNSQSALQNCQQNSQGRVVQLQNDLNACQATVQQLNGRIVVLNRDNDAINSQLLVLNQRIESNTSSSQNLSAQIRLLQGQKQELEQANQANSTRINALIVEKDQLTVLLTNCRQNQSNLSSLQAQITLLSRQESTLSAQLATCNNNLQTVRLENNTLSTAVTSCTEERSLLTTELNQSQTRVQSLQLQLNNAQNRIALLNEENANLDGTITLLSASTSQIAECNSQKDKLSLQVSTLTRNNQSLLVQIEDLLVIQQNCNEVRKQRDLYASTLMKFQSRLTSFRDNVLVQIPEISDNLQANTNQSTTTITRTINGGTPETIQVSGTNDIAILQQQLATCQSRLARNSNQRTRLGTSLVQVDMNTN